VGGGGGGVGGGDGGNGSTQQHQHRYAEDPAWHTAAALQVLENATFAAQATAEHLAEVEVAWKEVGVAGRGGSRPSSASSPCRRGRGGAAAAIIVVERRGPLPALLMALVPALARRVAVAAAAAGGRGSSAGGTAGGADAAAPPPPPPSLLALDPRACEAALRGVLSVAMNLSHQNPRGSEALLRAGALPACASLLSALLVVGGGGDDATTAVVSARRLVCRADLVGVALGVVINVASSCAGAGGGLGGDKADEAYPPSDLERVLIGVLRAAAELGGGGGEGGGNGNGNGTDAPQQQLPSAEASIVEAYAAIALGFLVVGDVRAPGLSARGPALLRLLAAQGGGGGEGGGEGGDKSAASAAAAAARLSRIVRRCLAFYVRAGAITEASRETMARMLLALEREGGVGVEGGVGGGSGGGQGAAA